MDRACAATLQVRNAVERALSALEPGDVVVVACSGGPDSLALAAATGWVAKRLGLFAGAVIVDHQLQEGSAEIAGWAAGVCGRLELNPVEIVAVNVGEVGGFE